MQLFSKAWMGKELGGRGWGWAQSCSEVARDGGKKGCWAKESGENRKLLESGIHNKAGAHPGEGMGPLPFTSLWGVPWWMAGRTGQED